MRSGDAFQPASIFIPSLTGIRALAALLVLGLHSVPAFFNPVQDGLTFFARGYLGVDFFFLLSGFIITHVYLRHLANPTPSCVMIFLWHRVIRLYPVHLTILAALVAIVALMTVAVRPVHSEQIWRFRDIPWHLLLMHAWGFTETVSWNLPSWSISAEWFAYLLFPCLAPFLARIVHRWIALTLATLALVMTAAIFAATDWGISSSWVGAPALIRVVGEFICGAALCRAVAIRLPIPYSGDMLGATAFVLFLLGACIGTPDFLLIGLLALTILGSSQSEGRFADLLGSAPLVWLGEISYSLYMVHFVILSFITHPALDLNIPSWSIPARIAGSVATVGACIMAAAVLFWVVERPTRRRLRNSVGVLAPA